MINPPRTLPSSQLVGSKMLSLVTGWLLPREATSPNVSEKTFLLRRRTSDALVELHPIEQGSTLKWLRNPRIRFKLAVEEIHLYGIQVKITLVNQLANTDQARHVDPAHIVAGPPAPQFTMGSVLVTRPWSWVQSRC